MGDTKRVSIWEWRCLWTIFEIYTMGCKTVSFSIILVGLLRC